MADEAQHRKELDQLRMAIEEKEAALKLERQSRIKFSLENKRLWRLLHNDEQVRLFLVSFTLNVVRKGTIRREHGVI